MGSELYRRVRRGATKRASEGIDNLPGSRNGLEGGVARDSMRSRANHRRRDSHPNVPWRAPLTEPSQGTLMTEMNAGIQVGQTVPDFKLTTFEPSKGDFGEFSLSENTKAGKWSILFFYPADFTFV